MSDRNRIEIFAHWLNKRIHRLPIVQQSLAFVLALLLALPPQQLQAQQPTETTHYIPLPSTAYTIANPPNDPLGNPAIYPPKAQAPSSISLVSGTDLQISGSPIVTTTTLTPANCAQTQSSVCGNIVTNYNTFTNSFPNAITQGSCFLANSQNAIVQCLNYTDSQSHTFSFPAEWEKASVDAYLIAHGHPASDDQYVYQYGRANLRNELRGWMLSQIWGIIQKKANNSTLTPDEQSVYNWLADIVYGREVAAAQAASSEFNKFAANPCNYPINQTVATALGVTINTNVFCSYGALQVSTGVFPPYPPGSYFTTIGHAAAFELPLGVTGTNALITAQADAFHLTAVATQSLPSSLAAEEEYLANIAAAPVSLGVAGGVFAQFDNLAPYRLETYAPKPIYKAPIPSRLQSFQLIKSQPEPVAQASDLQQVPDDGTPVEEQGSSLADATDVEPVVGGLSDDVEQGFYPALEVIDAADVSSGVVGVVLFAVTAIITAGIMAAQDQQNLNDDNNLAPYAASLLAAGPPDLTKLYQTSLGQTDIAESFILATLPDIPSTAQLGPLFGGSTGDTPFPPGTPLQGWFSPNTFSDPTFAVRPNAYNRFLSYYDPLEVLPTGYSLHNLSGYSLASIWNGFVISNPGRPDESFGLSLRYLDWYGTERRATLLEPNLWEIEPYTYQPNAPYCPAGPNGVTDVTQYQIFQCGSYVQEQLLMQVGMGGTKANAEIYVGTNPTLSDPMQIGVIVGQTQLNFTPQTPPFIVPDGAVSCTPPEIISSLTPPILNANPVSTVLPAGITIGGSPENGLNYTGGTVLSGMATNPADAGKTFPLTVFSSCGQNATSPGYAPAVLFPGVTTSQPFSTGEPTYETVNLVVASNVVFDQLMSSYTGYVNVPFSATIQTQSTPTASLAAMNLPAGLQFQDNGNGTGTISGMATTAGTTTVTLTGKNNLATQTATITITITQPTPGFVSPHGNTVVLTGNPGDPTDTILVTTNKALPYVLTAPGLDSHFQFTDNGDGTGKLVFTDANPEYFSVAVTLTATAKSNPALAASTTFTVYAEPVPPSIVGYQNGPLAFIAGMPTAPGQNPTVVTSAPSNTITTNVTGPFTFQPGIKTTLPSGLFWVSSGSGTIQVAGTPAVGSGGYYMVPINISNGTVTTLCFVQMVVYEAPTFPVYNGNYPLIFRTGQNTSVSLGAVGGFPLGKFQAQDPTLGSSAGLVFGPAPGVTIDPTTNSINGTPFSLAGGTSGIQNGTLVLSYNGGTLATNPYTLQLAAQIETGPVPSVLPGNSFGIENYIDQAPINVVVYVVPPGDANLDGKVTCADYSLVKAALNTSVNSPGYNAGLDQNGDGVINLKDLVIVTQNLAKGTVCH